MTEALFEVRPTSRFRKDYKLAQKRGHNLSLLQEVVRKLAQGEPLPRHNADHPLVGAWAGYRECHLKPDWLLVYKKDENTRMLILVRTGSHADLAF